MQRVTISIDDTLAAEYDSLLKTQGYTSRSEAIRDLVRGAVGAHHGETPGHPCVANLSYVYNHHERAMASRLMEMQHAHHDIVLATTHVHLDHDHCLETVMLSGDVGQIRAFSDALKAERGVRNTVLNLIPVHHSHDHDHDGAGHTHADGGVHLSPR